MLEDTKLLCCNVTYWVMWLRHLHEFDVCLCNSLQLHVSVKLIDALKSLARMNTAWCTLSSLN